VPPAVALLNYISSGILWRIFCQTGTFTGFSQQIINFVGRINEAAMKGVGNIIFHNFGAQWKDTPSYCDFSGFISIVFGICRKDQRSCMGGVEVGGHNMINMTIRELYYAFADFFQNCNFFL
jgi:hypothetical protein